MAVWEEFGLERNPFEVKPVELYGLVPLDTFIGRQNEVKKLKHNITASNRSISLVVGEKGIGKTSLANKAKSELYQDYFVPLEEIDCQGDWSSREFIINLLANLYFLHSKTERYDKLPPKYVETAEKIKEEISEIFKEESKSHSAQAGAAGYMLGGGHSKSENLKEIPIEILRMKFSSVIETVKDEGYEGLLLHYNNLDNLEDEVEGFSRTLADLRDFLLTENCHFLFLGDKRMEQSFRSNKKVEDCISTDIQLESMDDNAIWNIIQKRCSVFEIEGRNHKVPVNYECVKFLTKLHSGNIRQVFSALETAILELESRNEDIHKINLPTLKEILKERSDRRVEESVQPKAMEVLKFFLDNEEEELTNREISEKFSISQAQTSQYLRQLQDSNLIIKSGEAGNNNFYKPLKQALWLSIETEDAKQSPIFKYME